MMNTSKLTHSISLPILFFLFLHAIPAQAQQPQLRWAGSEQRIMEITFGQQVDMTVSIELPEGSYANFPTFEDINSQGLTVISMGLDTIANNGNNLTLSAYYKVTAFEPGEKSISNLSVGLLMGEESSTLTTTDSLILVINDITDIDTSEASIRDIADIEREPYTAWEIIRVALIIAVIVALVILAVKLIRKLRSRPKSEPKPKPSTPQPTVPPMDKALAELERLRQRELWKQGLLKEYYTALTDVVRLYIKERYAIDTIEMTSQQSLQAFAISPGYTPERQTLLSSLLNTADMVKFAKSTPPEYQHDAQMNNAVQFIKLEPKPTEADSEISNTSTTQQ